MNDFPSLSTIFLAIFPLIFAFTIPQAVSAHIIVAAGDPTPKLFRRTSFDPLRHIDLVGTIIVPAAMLLLGGFLIFGWAKPLPSEPRNMRNPKRAAKMLSMVNVVSSFIMCVLWLVVILISPHVPESLQTPMRQMGAIGASINAWLVAINLIPLPPFNVGRLIACYLPHNAAQKYLQIEVYTTWILIGLLVLGGLGRVLQPLVDGVIWAAELVLYPFM